MMHIDRTSNKILKYWNIYEIFSQLSVSLIHQDGATVVGVGRTPAASSYIPAAELSPTIPQDSINLFSSHHVL